MSALSFGAPTPLWRYRNPGDYLRHMRSCFSALAQGQPVKLHWADDGHDLSSFRRAFLQALQRRINLKAGINPQGRKFDPAYQTGLLRDRGRLNDMARRIRVYAFDCPEINARFGYRLSRRDD